MLIRITDHCTMGCSHCLVDSTPSNKHMDFSTFMSSIRFAISCGDMSLLISGGEATDHPQFFDFLNYALMNFNGKIFVLSHGAYLKTFDDVDKLVGRYPQVTFQFTSDPLYYKTTIPKEITQYIESKYSNSYVTTDLNEVGAQIYPQGRATRMGVTADTTRSVGAKCFNLRSVINSGYSLGEAILALRSRFKMCTPSVNIDGSISMGESNQCPSIGNINSTLEQLTESIKCSQCDECGMIGKLDSRYKQAIGFKS